MEVFYTDNPTVSDTIIFDFVTTDSDSDPIDPYRVDEIVIYYIERGFSVENIYPYEQTAAGQVYTEYFKDAVPIQVFGTDDVPAWLSTDTTSAFIEKIDTDDDGNTLYGTFRLTWEPKFAREGNYVLCYKWTEVLAGDTSAENLYFYILSDTKQNTSMPSHRTVPEKYETLLQRYMPQMFSMYLSTTDVTPDVLLKLNKSVAKGFTGVEDLTNQMIDLFDSNVISEALLPYLSKFFNSRLYGQDTTLWRRQIKRAVPLNKKKGTLSGLEEAFENADMKLNKLTKLWQIVSSSTWQECFTGGESWVLEKVALADDGLNFELFKNDVAVSLSLVSFATTSGITTMTWESTPLEDDDVIRIIYKFADIADQSTEDYIRDLPLSDQRDYDEDIDPKKNWNVRVIAEDDPMFDVIIPTKHPFSDLVKFGKIRTEFPYSENIYNMEEYSGSTRDSTDPCDIDKDFLDDCSACQSSKFSIDVDIEDLSAERLIEVEEILKDYMPFHAIVHSINYIGTKSEFIPSPQEDIEILLSYHQDDNIIATQTDFNRLIEEGSSYLLELKRNMLADTNVTNHTGTGSNLAVSIFSPGVYFNRIIDVDDNVLEILSGTYAGEYTLTNPSRHSMDIVESISFPLDSGEFSFRISNVIYSDIVSITRIDDIRFYDEDIEFVAYGAVAGFKIIITSGIYAGTYTVTSVNTDNSVTISGLSGSISAANLNYELRTSSNVLRYTGTTAGSISTQQIGKVECSLTAESVHVSPGDYVLYSGDQYKILTVENDSVPYLYIENYTGGDVVGVASISVYRRKAEGIGYLSASGMKINGIVPFVDGTLEDNTFKESYLILIGSNYYSIEEIDGSEMTLSGHLLEWGLSGISVNYSIVQFEKVPVITQNDHYFEFLDRRGNDSIVISTESSMPMAMRSSFLNGNQPIDTLGQSESISIDIEYRN